MLNIKQRQQNLQTYYLFYNGKIDGIEGVNTKKAYKIFSKVCRDNSRWNIWKKHE